MSLSSLLILLALSSPLVCLAQAPFGSIYACVAYCIDLRRVVSMSCFMTTSECEGNVLSQCGVKGSQLFTYPFTDFDECSSFRQKYFDELTADVTRNEDSQNDGGSTDSTNSTTAVTPVVRAQCGCQEIIYNIAWNFFSIDTDQEDPCEAILSKYTTEKVPDLCPKKFMSNFFLGTVCNFVDDAVDGVLDLAFVAPTCHLITEVLEEGFGLPVSKLESMGEQALETINSGINSTLLATSGAVCGSLLCNRPGSLCQEITNGLGPILRATGACPASADDSSQSSGMVIQGSVSIMIMASVLLLLFNI